MSTAEITVRMSFWYALEASPAGWWVQPCACMSGPAIGEPVFIRLARHYGPYASKAQAMTTGDALIERFEKEQE